MYVSRWLSGCGECVGMFLIGFDEIFCVSFGDIMCNFIAY